jgi:tetratricopeptide (TPR) repeat protein
VEWNVKYDLDPPAVDQSAADFMGGGDSTDDMVAEYERVLQEYLEMFADDTVGGMDGFFDEASGETYYEKDDGYEGDLHTSIATLYMARGDNSENILAASHLEQAVRLYELSGEQDGQNMATAKFNLSILHARNGDYLASAQLHSEALDIFRAVVGEGVNPMGMGVDELSTLLEQQQQEQNSAYQNQHFTTSKTTTTSSSTATSQATKKTAPSMQAANTANDAGPTILVDVQRFLSQNDSLREEL